MLEGNEHYPIPPQPDDEVYATRGDLRRMLNSIWPNIERQTELLFEDKRDENGKVIRPSLERYIEEANKQREYLCMGWKGIRLLIVGGTAVGSFVLVVIEVIKQWP